MEDDVHDIQTLNNYITSTSDSLQKIACRNLFALVSSLAMETVYATDRTKKFEMYVKLKMSFDDIMANYGSTSDGFDRLFVHFNNNTWPEVFKTYVTRRLNAKITERFRKEMEKESKSASEDLKRTWYIGYVIEQEVEEVKRYINNVLNPLYDADKLPSGRNVQQLLNAIRRNLWCTESVKKARKSAYQKIGYTKKNGQKSILLCDDLTLSDAIEAQYLKFRGNIKKNLEWFPDCWISFLLMGKPIGLDKASDLFMGGFAPMTVAKTVAPISSIAGMVSKETRKMHYRSIHSDFMLPKNAKKQRQMSTPTSSMTSSSVGGYSGLTKLKMLNQKLDILKSRDASLQVVQEIRLIENKIMKVIDECTDDIESSGQSSAQSVSSPLSFEVTSNLFEDDNENNDGPIKSTTV
jgi:hypothetical protein